MALTIAIILALALFVMMTYNSMVTLRNRVKEAWSDIDVQLKRRYNLIPNIVETVKGYATHEESVLTQVTEARSQAINATNVKDQGQAENMLSGALKSLFAVAENYPDLKANENFLQLQNELVDTEDKIQSSRRFYNGVVRDFNTKIQQFPASIIAGMFKFMAEEFFEIENDEEKKNVKVDFNKEAPATPAPVAVTPTEPTPETPTEPTPETPAEPTPETPAEPTPEAPKEEPVAETPTETPTEPTPETPAEPTPEAPKEEPVAETPAETTPEAPKEEPVAETPAEPAPETPTEPTPETPTEEKPQQ
ncbi:LemA family protein [Candidatus Peregrinibacteria bacterium]|nr:LemA family protein [Candidatus Peregrinibacteria bacterium]